MKSASTETVVQRVVPRVALRFLSGYFVLFASARLIGFGFLAYPARRMWDPVVSRFASAVGLDMQASLMPPGWGPGDTTWLYVQALLSLIISLAGCGIWAYLDRRKGHDRLIARFLTVGCRYYLAVVLIQFGVGKLFKLQFATPSFLALLTPFGDASLQPLLWTFMGASTSYSMFAGLMEVVPALLLLFRRTTTLGALIAAGVMTNVVVLNFSYDVGVKLGSIHLLAIAVGLLMSDWRRLAGLLLLNRSTAPADLSFEFRTPSVQRSLMFIKVVFIGTIVASQGYRGFSNYRAFGDGSPKPPLYGVWDVERYERDGESVPALVGDEDRWRRLIVDGPRFVVVQRMDASRTSYAFEQDEDEGTFSLALRARDGTRAEPSRWTYARPSPDELLLEGTDGGARLDIRLTRRGRDDFPLAARQFRWITDRPGR